MHAQMALRPGVSLPHSYSGRRSSTSLVHPRSPTPTLVSYETASGPLRLKSVLASSKSSDKLQPPGPSKLPHNDSSAEAQQPEGDPDTGLGKLLKLLSKYPITSWLAGLAEKVLKGAVLGNDGRTLRVVRMIVIFSMFCIAALFREASLQNARVRPREVLYSNFVTLVDEGRVRAARLEAGTSKLYFDIHVPEEPAATSTAAAAPSSSAPASASAASGSAAMTSTPAVQAVTAGLTGQASAAAVASASSVPTAVSSGTKSTAPYRMQKQFFIKLADKSDPLLIQRVVAAGVEFAVVKASLLGALYNILITALAVWLPLLPLIFLVRRMLEDRNSSARKKRSNGPESVTITFDDVAGVDSAKEELAEVVSVMKSVKASYKKLKVKMPSGVLLCGPPGTGKTLLAKAVAGEAGIPFMAVSASEFVEMYVGRGAARIRELFAEARKVAPCVVFIDELDAVGARRGMGYNDERDQTLNQLLTELDGFEGRPGVLFLAATNRIDVLDPALLRPGRLSRKVVVPLPDEAGRRDILGVHLRGVPLDEEEDKEDIVERLARVTSGFSGAELANVVNEASLLSARKTQDFVGFRELLEGVQRTRYGVNGQSASKGSLQQTVNNWLMNIATEKRKAKNAVA